VPLTPFHFGPAFLIGMLFPRRINMAAILLACVAIDIEPIYCLFNNCQLHGLLHTYVGATLFSLTVVTAIIYLGKRYFKKVSDALKVEQDYSVRSIVAGALVGGWSHVFLDSLMHSDVTPFWPALENPMWQAVDNGTNYLITIAGFVLGGVVYFWRMYKLRREKHSARV
jgi:membrane-bound metal-dependent hydrolase YbcI (DUF457 family)